jgi:hypothetical protein
MDATLSASRRRPAKKREQDARRFVKQRPGQHQPAEAGQGKVGRMPTLP